MSNTLVTEYVLEAPGYDATGRRITQTTKEISEAQDKAAAAAKRMKGALQDSTLPGLDRIAGDARRAVSPSASGPGGRAVATVGGMSWIHRDPASPVSPQAHPTVRPHIDWSSARKQTSDFFDGIRDGVQGAMQDLSPLKALGTTLAAFAAVGAATGFSLMKEAASFDSLRMSLIAVEGSARAAKAELADLKKIAKAPGIGFEESVRGYTGLRNAGYDEKFAERIEREFANATATGGGGAEEFGRIMVQLRQAAGREYLSQEDLTPIGEAGVPVNSILKRRFGTGDTEELKSKGVTAKDAIRGIVEELERLPRVAGGAKGVLDNIADAIKYAEVEAGDQLNRELMPMVDQFSDVVQELTEGGVVASAFADVAANIKEAFDVDENGMQNAAQMILVASMDMSAAARNLAENGKGAVDFLDKAGDAWQWFAHPKSHKAPWDSDYEDWKEKQKDGEFDTSLGAEHARSADQIDRQSRTAKEREEMHRAGFKGDLGSWQRLPAEKRKAMLDEADRKAKANGTGPDGKKDPAGKEGGTTSVPSKEEQTQERIARATEKTADYMKRQMDLNSVLLGGGEMARLGVSPVEMSGRAIGGKERAIRHAVELLAQAMGGFVDSREVGNARHSSRT